MMRYFPIVWPRKNIDGSIPAVCEARADHPGVEHYNAPVRPRFHLAEFDQRSGRGALADDEASHLIRVLRLGVGAEIDAFDGRGGMYRAAVSALTRDAVSLTILGAVAAAPEPAIGVTVAMSVLKGDKMDSVVRDVTMMGAAVVQPIVSARSEMSLATLARAHRAERWQRIAVSSVKQCGRAVVPDIRHPLNLSDWLGDAASGATLALVEPAAGGGRRFSELPSQVAVNLLVGPEGGWTPEELSMMADAGVATVSLGARTLRAETAPLVALAALFEAWRAW
jgi:16S rRNA (uracil1498-N3)-methyltransferase